MTGGLGSVVVAHRMSGADDQVPDPRLRTLSCDTLQVPQTIMQGWGPTRNQQYGSPPSCREPAVSGLPLMVQRMGLAVNERLDALLEVRLGSEVCRGAAACAPGWRAKSRSG